MSLINQKIENFLFWINNYLNQKYRVTLYKNKLLITKNYFVLYKKRIKNNNQIQKNLKNNKKIKSY